MFVKFVKDDKTIEEVSISPEMIPFPTDIVVLEIIQLICHVKTSLR